MSVSTSPSRKTPPAAAPNKYISPNSKPHQAVSLAGITPFTTIDFPGCLSAVFFLSGCSWRCGFCQNNALWSKEKPEGNYSWAKAAAFLESRKGLLDGVVVSGGEPTENETLPSLLEWIRGFGFRTALHTNGNRPDILKESLPHCDWVGLDIKGPLRLYDEITRIAGSAAGIPKSIRLIEESGVDYECRTTYHPSLFDEKGLLEMGKEIAALGVQRLALQGLQPQNAADPRLRNIPLPAPLISSETEKKLKKLFPDFLIRL